MSRKSLSLSLSLIALLIVTLSANATTYVFGEDGSNQNLTDPVFGGSTWTSGNTYIIAGDCYVPDDSTLTIQAGVTVSFDYDYLGDSASTILTVIGTILLEGNSSAPIRITNAGSTDQDYNGFVLDGSVAGYEGRMAGEYCIFEEGGKTTSGFGPALINLKSNSELDLEACYIRFSENDAIRIAGSDVLLNLVGCQVDSSDGSGIGFDESNESYSAIFNVNGCIVEGNGDCGILLPSPADEVPTIVERTTIRDNFRHGIVGPGQYIGAWHINAIIRNNYIDYNGRNGILTSGTNSGTISIHNNVLARNGYGGNNVPEAGSGSGIEITDISFSHPTTLEGLSVDIKFNHIAFNYDIGLVINYWSTGRDWPENLALELNVFYYNCNNAPRTGVGLWDTNGQIVQNEPDLPTTNAFRDDVGLGCDESPCIVHNGGDITVPFMIEEGYYTLPGDRHFVWDGNNSVINVDENILDVDGSPADCGFYGGPLGDRNGNWRATWYSDWGWLRQEDHAFVGLNSERVEMEEATIPYDAYRYFSDFTVPARSSYTIEAGATILASSDDIRFIIEGDVIADGSASDRITFATTVDNDLDQVAYDWEGILFTESTSLASIFSYVDVINTAGTFPGIYIDNRDVDPTASNIDFYFCNVSNCYYGYYIVESDVKISGGSAHNNRHSGIYLENCVINEAYITSVDIYENEDASINSAGIKLNNSDPFISSSGIEENEQHGIFADNTSQPSIFDENRIYNNDVSSIVIDGDSQPSLNNEHNDIVPDAWEYAIDNINQLSPITAEQNWWGTDEPDPELLFSNPEGIDIDPWDMAANTDDVSNFKMGAELLFAKNPREAIPYLIRAAQDEGEGGDRYVALKYLRSAYIEAGENLDEYAEFAANFADTERQAENEIGADFADSQILWSLVDRGRGDEAMEELIARRDGFDNAVDSIHNEFQIVLMERAMGNRGGAGIDAYQAKLSEHEARIENLSEARAAAVATAKRKVTTPESFDLIAINPNPFNSTSSITVAIPETADLTLALTDLTGRQVLSIANGRYEAGIKRFSLEAGDLSSGLYFVQMKSAKTVVSKHILLLR